MAISGTAKSCILLLLCLASVALARPVITDPREVKSAINVEDSKQTELEAGVTCTPVLSSSSLYNWTSVPITLIGTTTFHLADTFSFTIPSVIPSDAKEVLLHVGVYNGNDNVPQQNVRIFTQIGTNAFNKYLLLYTTPQSAVNANSDNMWFPMPLNRMVFLSLSTAVGDDAGAQLFAIGYR